MNAAERLKAIETGKRAATHPDAELVAQRHEFQNRLRVHRAQPDDAMERDDTYEAYWATIDQITATPAQSLVGLAAKAQVIEEYTLESDAMDDLVKSLMAECIRLGIGTSPPLSMGNPDASKSKSTKLAAPTSSISLIAVGRRIGRTNALIEQLGEVMPGTLTEDQDTSIRDAQRAAFRELDALIGLASHIRPSSPADLLVHMAVIAHHLSEIDAHELSAAEIKTKLEEILRLAAGAMSLLGNESCVGIEEISNSWTAERPKVLWPDVETVAAELAGWH
jgi:hypothetical protein